MTPIRSVYAREHTLPPGRHQALSQLVSQGGYTANIAPPLEFTYCTVSVVRCVQSTSLGSVTSAVNIGSTAVKGLPSMEPHMGLAVLSKA
jgi:hypothetical protein